MVSLPRLYSVHYLLYASKECGGRGYNWCVPDVKCAPEAHQNNRTSYVRELSGNMLEFCMVGSYMQRTLENYKTVNIWGCFQIV